MLASLARMFLRRTIGLEFIRSATLLKSLAERARFEQQIALLSALEAETGTPLAPWLEKSRSQLGQDLFAAAMSGFKRGGYFVEFGATDGLSMSNTYMLEAELGWTGILAEPARIWHADLARNRTAEIDHDCVLDRTGEQVSFHEVAGEAELSTASQFAGSRAAKEYPVRTVTLADLLARHSAPRVIDYLSLDTEGSELTILKAFDFTQYDVRLITCEHNFASNRAAIHELLTAKGYTRVFEQASQFDDWYVSASAP